ncbi:MAG TPA: ABC transporter permease [Candidatus Limnocylindria bacterium]|jgi:ABC-2 type transport system permease protein|nr:ABC transporter permease [Candidatus Limnocylindria bacterium]
MIGVVFSAEFLRRVTSRTYIIGTVIGALGIVALALLPRLFAGFGGGSDTIVLVGDPALTTPARTLLGSDYRVVATLPRLDATPNAAFLDAHRRAQAVVVLGRGTGGLRASVYARDPSLFRTAFRRDLAPLQLSLATGLSVAQVRQRTAVPVDVHDVGGRFASASSAEAAKGVGYLLSFLLYLAILLNAQSILASVAEEKTSRIAELLVATIAPVQLLTAKILAAAATGLIQLAIWLVAGIVANSAGGGIFSDAAAQASNVPALDALALPQGEVIAFIAFFAAGLVQYGVLFAAAGSLINRTEDIGSVQGPLVLPIVLGFFFAQMGLQYPNATNTVVASQIPLLGPFVMFTRIAVSSVPAWQIVLSLAINVGAAVLLAFLAGKVYRVGLLLYGRPPSLRQVVATLRA